MRIGLDAGHGGINEKGEYVTSGKRSPFPIDDEWFYEGVNNRIYAKEYKRVLEQYGHEVAFVIDPDDYKDVPLSTRVSIVNQMNLDLLVSIHSNAGPEGNTTARGYEVFVSPNASQKSLIYAERWIREMQKRFPELNNRGRKSANFSMVSRTNCPAMLLELEFHSNPDAVRLLRTWEFRLQTAIALAESLK